MDCAYKNKPRKEWTSGRRSGPETRRETEWEWDIVDYPKPKKIVRELLEGDKLTNTSTVTSRLRPIKMDLLKATKSSMLPDAILDET